MARTLSELANHGRMMQRHNGKWLNRISQGLFVLLGVLVVYVLGRACFANPKVFVEQILNGLQLGFIYALIALGYTMIYGIVKLINFAHGDVFMVGAFTSFFTISNFQLHRWPLWLFPGLAEGLSTLIGTVTVILVSMLFSALLAVVIERFAYKPLRSRPRIAALITAIGVSFFIEYFGALPFVYTADYITYPRPFEVSVYSGAMISPLWIGGAWALFIVSLIVSAGLTWASRRGNLKAQTLKRHPLLQFGLLFFGFMAAVLTLTGMKIETGGKVWDLSVSNVMLVIMGASIFLQVLLQYVVNHTRIGKAMRAAAYDKAVAQLMGINVDGVITTTFALGGGLAGAAGVLYATAFKQVHHLMGIIPGLKAFVAAVIGGIGSIPGAFVGALIMGQAEVMAAGFISTPMRDAVSFSLLIVVLLVWPQGIFGEPPAEKV
ncbi:MAG TPA: branched-chain amino acid ABC transporter permease [Anaerolineae bacterium]|nr:branched-chain amino acid ABC transporter permease [Anaerolineae bacterium]HQH37996.1 branched-chain amino acid ABC transporter permease [Anaerolineae bacterium]